VEFIVYEEGRAFGWSGDAMLGRQDHHIFRIEELPDGRALCKQEDGLNGKKSNFFSPHGRGADWQGLRQIQS
jgi:hypothetical protein